jgi:hypothetical protein
MKSWSKTVLVALAGILALMVIGGGVLIIMGVGVAIDGTLAVALIGNVVTGITGCVAVVGSRAQGAGAQ